MGPPLLERYDEAQCPEPQIDAHIFYTFAHDETLSEPLRLCVRRTWAGVAILRAVLQLQRIEASVQAEAAVNRTHRLAW